MGPSPTPIRAVAASLPEKDQRQRLRDIGDARMLLDGHAGEPVRPSPFRAGAVAALAGIAVLAVAVTIYSASRTPHEHPNRWYAFRSTLDQLTGQTSRSPRTGGELYTYRRDTGPAPYW